MLSAPIVLTEIKIMKKILSLLFLSLSLNAQAHECKACDLSHRWWINLGMGVGTSFGSDSLNHNAQAAGQLSFNGMITDTLFVTLQHTATSGSNSSTDAHDVGLLLGYKSKHPHWYWSGAAGIAYYESESYDNAWWSRRRNYHYSSGAAVPVEAQLFWTPVKHLGIGLIGHAAVSRDPYAVALIGLQIS